jgi:hypothetical protein
MRKPTSITPASLRDVSEHMCHRLLGSQIKMGITHADPLAGQTSQSPHRLRSLRGWSIAEKSAMTRMTRPETHQNLIYSSKEHTPGRRPKEPERMPTAKHCPPPLGVPGNAQPISDLLCDENSQSKPANSE